MLKQSLVQEKISDLTIGAPQPSNTTSSSSTNNGGNGEKKIIETNIISLISSPTNPNSKRIFGSSKYAREIIIATTAANSSSTDTDPQQPFLPAYLKKSSPLSNVNNDESGQISNFSSNARNSFVNNNNNSNNSHGFNQNHQFNSSNNNNARFSSTSATNLAGDDAATSSTNNFEATMKLSYLEKSIRFIQEQHTEILNGLHQEIEKLKTENRELHFKLATRKTSDSGAEAEKQTTGGGVTSSELNDPGFGKAYAESYKETNLGKKLTDIKSSFEINKYEEMAKKLKEAESKNDYLTSVINELQTRRHSNSAQRTNSQAISNSHDHYSKLGVHNIVSTEPLKIRLNETDEPRSPNAEESDALLKRLFESYKLQKQQISNMKIVLRDLMANESLSNQSMTMARDLLEEPNRINQYLIDHGSTIQKLSIPKSSSTGRSNLNPHHRFSSQVLLANNDTQQPCSSMRGPPPNLNLTGTGFNIVHLPPLITNPAKYPERQRRTQLLQKQRLRKEYFH